MRSLPLRSYALRAWRRTRRRDKEPRAIFVVALVVADLLFVCAIWGILHSPPPGPWRPAPQSVAAADGLHAHPQPLQTLIGPGSGQRSATSFAGVDFGDAGWR
jgi:hypothetical protein